MWNHIIAHKGLQARRQAYSYTRKLRAWYNKSIFLYFSQFDIFFWGTYSKLCTQISCHWDESLNMQTLSSSSGFFCRLYCLYVYIVCLCNSRHTRARIGFLLQSRAALLSCICISWKQPRDIVEIRLRLPVTTTFFCTQRHIISAQIT